MSALKMYVLLTNREADMKLGIYQGEYWIYTHSNWYKFNTAPNNFELAKAKFNRLCDEHISEELRRKNQMPIG